eukprot:275059-Chlamydomonas_euryale.AAC.1
MSAKAKCGGSSSKRPNAARPQPPRSGSADGSCGRTGGDDGGDGADGLADAFCRDEALKLLQDRPPACPAWCAPSPAEQGLSPVICSSGGSGGWLGAMRLLGSLDGELSPPEPGERNGCGRSGMEAGGSGCHRGDGQAGGGGCGGGDGQAGGGGCGGGDGQAGGGGCNGGGALAVDTHLSQLEPGGSAGPSRLPDRRSSKGTSARQLATAGERCEGRGAREHGSPSGMRTRAAAGAPGGDLSDGHRPPPGCDRPHLFDELSNDVRSRLSLLAREANVEQHGTSGGGSRGDEAPGSLLADVLELRHDQMSVVGL